METKQIILLAVGTALLLMPVAMPVLRYLGRLLKASKVSSGKILAYLAGGALLASVAFLPPDYLGTPPSGPDVEPTPVDLSGPFYAGVLYRLSEEQPVGVWEYISLRDKILVNVREQYDYRFLPAEEFWVEMLKYIQTNWETLKTEDVSNHLKMLSMQFYQKGTGGPELEEAWHEGYGAADAALEGNIPNPPTPGPEPTPDGDTCPDCNGSGKTGDGITDCLRCDGDGRLDESDGGISGRKAVIFHLPNNSMNRSYVSRVKRELSSFAVGDDPSCDVVLLNYYDYKDLAKELGLRRFPSVVLVEDGAVVEQWTGTGKPLSVISDFLGG